MAQDSKEIIRISILLLQIDSLVWIRHAAYAHLKANMYTDDGVVYNLNNVISLEITLSKHDW